MGKNSSLRSRFVHNAGWMVFVQIYQMVISLVVGVICARYLGPSNYGIINYVASFVSFFSIVCALGLETVVVKEVVADRSNEGLILGSSIVIRFAAGVLSMISICIVVFALNGGDETMTIVAFLQSLALLFNSTFVVENWYQADLKSKTPVLIKSFAYTVMCAYKIILLVLGMGVEWFAFSTSLDALIIAVLYLIFYRKDSERPLRFSFDMAKRLFSQSHHLMIAYMMAVIYSQMDKIMIGQMADMGSVGVYAAAVTICNMWLFIPKALSDSASPIIMDLSGRDDTKFRLRLAQLVSGIFWIGNAFALLLSVLSGFVIDILYGVEYAGAQEPLMIIIWSTVFSSLSYARSIWMLCENQQRYTKMIMVWGVVVNLVLNFFLIQAIGICGAAFATLATEFVCCAVAPFFYKDIRPYMSILFSGVTLRWLRKRD